MNTGLLINLILEIFLFVIYCIVISQFLKDPIILFTGSVSTIIASFFLTNSHEDIVCLESIPATIQIVASSLCAYILSLYITYHTKKYPRKKNLCKKNINNYIHNNIWWIIWLILLFFSFIGSLIGIPEYCQWWLYTFLGIAMSILFSLIDQKKEEDKYAEAIDKLLSPLFKR